MPLVHPYGEQHSVEEHSSKSPLHGGGSGTPASKGSIGVVDAPSSVGGSVEPSKMALSGSGTTHASLVQSGALELSQAESALSVTNEMARAVRTNLTVSI